jgi:hypothetical protein
MLLLEVLSSNELQRRLFVEQQQVRGGSFLLDVKPVIPADRRESQKRAEGVQQCTRWERFHEAIPPVLGRPRSVIPGTAGS